MTQATKFTLTITNSSNKPQNVSLFGAGFNLSRENHGNPESIVITYDCKNYVSDGKAAYKSLLVHSQSIPISKFHISKICEGNPYDCKFQQHSPNSPFVSMPLNYTEAQLINGGTEITYNHPHNSKVVFEISFLS